MLRYFERFQRKRSEILKYFKGEFQGFMTQIREKKRNRLTDLPSLLKAGDLTHHALPSRPELTVQIKNKCG